MEQEVWIEERQRILRLLARTLGLEALEEEEFQVDRHATISHSNF